jgi:hypothetical protein
MPEAQHDATNPPLSTIQTVLVGTAVTLGNVALGYNTHALSIVLDGIAYSSRVNDADLQWTFNSFLLAFVSQDSRGYTLATAS